MNKENIKFQRNLQEKGITLVALVITIVILIILATVAINFAFGGDGLIRRAEQASEFYANDTKYTDESISNVTGYVDGVLSELGIETGDGGDDTPTVPEGWDTSKVTPVVSEDNVTVPVPIGYTASNATGENAVSSGFVIYENVVNGTDEENKANEVNDSNVPTAKTSRNQFVWVPVDDISQIANVAQNGGTDINGRTNYQGKLYNFSTTGATEKESYGQGTTSYREPDVVTYYDGTDATGDASYFTEAISSSMTGEQFKTQLQEELNEMIESVATYGGFYIGRYETGNLAESPEAEPVVVKGNNDISNVNWYYMYQNSKLIKANDNVESTMIWGCMWDRTLIWLAETNAEDSANGKSYAEIANSRTWGNYNNSEESAATNSGDKQPTGTNDAWSANNIYDLAGNVWDWTIEAYYTNYRVYRGGDYSSSGSNGPASYRYDSYDPSTSYSNDGTRSALYVEL